MIGSNKPGPLISSSVESFVKELGSRSSAPGGGSAAAVIAAMVSRIVLEDVLSLSTVGGWVGRRVCTCVSVRACVRACKRVPANRRMCACAHISGAFDDGNFYNSIFEVFFSVVFTFFCPGHQGAGLGAMTGWMTYGKRKFEDLDAEMRLAIAPLDAAMKELLRLVDADTAAFKAYTVSCLSFEQSSVWSASGQHCG